MHPASLWLVLALAGLSLSAGQFVGPGINNQPVQPSAKPRHTATGTVVNSVTGEPIRRALVRLNSAGVQQSGFTGADGRFSIDGVPEGPLYISAQRPGFFDESQVSRRSTSIVNFGAATGDLLVKLIPAAHIEGRVLDSDGEPIENAQIEVLVRTILNGRKQWQNRGGTSTDESGAYEIGDLFPGTYLIRTRSMSVFAAYLNVQGANGASQVYPAEFYPDAPDESSAQPLDLAGGETAHADFTLSPVPAFAVTGTIAGVQNGLGISCQDSGGREVAVGVRFNPKTGKYALHGVPAGSWNISFTSNNSQGKTYYAEQQVNVSAADVRGIDVVLQPRPSIPVHIVNGNANQVQVLLSGEASLFTGQISYMAQFDPSDGSMQVRDVSPGSYTVSAHSFGRGCVESIESGDTDLMREPFTVLAGSQPQPIEVTLSNQCATLSVSVSAPPGEETGALLLVEEGSSTPPLLMNIRLNSKFQFQNLTPATYQVYAFADITNLEYADPEALRGFPSQEVTLNAGQNSDLQLELISRNGK